MAMGLCHYSKKPSQKEISNLEKFNTAVTIMILNYENIFNVSSSYEKNILNFYSNGKKIGKRRYTFDR